MIRDILLQFNQLLEAGMYNSAVLEEIFNTLEQHPEELLPEYLPELKMTAFLLCHNNFTAYSQRLSFDVLHWLKSEGQETELLDVWVKNLQYVFEKEGKAYTEKEILQLCSERGYPATHTYRFADEHTGKKAGFYHAISPKAPITRFRGWLKQANPTTMNDTGIAVMQNLFPRFIRFPDPYEYLRYEQQLKAAGIQIPPEQEEELAKIQQFLQEGINVETTLHRRYAGGDGLLPRGRYYSVCSNEQGDDQGTLSRELMAYTDRRLPGVVFVGDSTNASLNALLGNQIGVKPGFCAIYVFLFAPDNTSDLQVFGKVYADLLSKQQNPQAPLHVFVLESRVKFVEIENVIDLRLPEVQTWFFHNFAHGEGLFLHKSEGSSAGNFYDLLPAMMHPELGGSGFTHAVGSWMRSSGVNALIYPSARSNAAAQIHKGQLMNFRGWNLVDYRSTDAIPATEITVDHEMLHYFIQKGIKLHTEPPDSPFAGSFAVSGNERKWQGLLEQIKGM